MTADEFVKIVRKGSEKLRVDEVTINAGGQELHGKGMLQISRKSINVEVTIDEGAKLPEIRTGIYTKKNNWKLTGLIEDSLQFKCEYAGMPINTHRPWPGITPGGITRCTLDLHPINLIPTGWDAMTRAERKEFLKQNQLNPSNGETPATNVVEDETRDNVSFYATLLEYPLHTSSWGKEIKGETEYFNFVLTKTEDTSDLHVSLESKKEYTSQGEEKDWKKFHAFMNALAFVNGTNAWPYRIQYWRAGQKLIDRVAPAKRLAKTIHAPFPETLAFNARTGSIKWNFPDTIKLITKFFDTESALSEEVAYLLFLFRQAGSKGVHRDITTVTLCVLFENLVRHIFKELKLEEYARMENSLFNSFEQAKKKIIEQMDQQLIAIDSGYKRVQDVIQSAEVFNAKHMLQTIVKHFNLQWKDDMELVFKTWQQARHPGVHHSEYATRTEDDLREISLAESRVAGAINILLLKLFGYSGYMRHSAFEDGYRQI
jgi:hypothetical protein